MHALLAPWRNWNQRTDTAPGGLPAPNALNDCGPESVAECLWHLTGIELEAEYILDDSYAPGYVGYTDVPHLAGYLERRASCPVAVRTVGAGQACDDLRQALQGALSAGHPWIHLFFFDLDTLTGGHWCPVVEVGDAHVVRSNPWTGAQETFTWEALCRIQQGIGLELLRRRDPALPRA